ncbi:toxin-antitoxin system YwqK family antitoxin [Maribacter sp. HTCC2170]|uniref:toxin-antitoxin system YwqK family antitoxin n=1 Tax=Maribacter sp. (strain HTCC2170 / KCCM 42371) TaxID=313603 RepID=UPI00006AE5DD|nr:hypothetical protein [Maribacter sp. HTCC2170]EAR00496.1 hypothetical exported 24-amino acid repeat protein [Maribacter sp. HTCC2170]
MSIKSLPILILLFWGIGSNNEAKYHKEYYESGRTKSEGWLENGIKNGYWKFYHKNGKIAEQGHFKKDVRERYWHFYNPNKMRIKEGGYSNGEMANWWIFYDTQGRVNHKCQLYNGKKNGYCLKYKNEKLISAEKYENGTKVKEWFSFVGFRRENKLSDLK